MDKYLPKIKILTLYVLAGVGGLVLVLFILGFIGKFVGYQHKTFVTEPDYNVGAPIGGIHQPQEQGLPSTTIFDRKSSSDIVSQQNQRPPEGSLTQRKVTKNGSLSLLVKNAEETAQGVQAIATELNGFVSDAQIYEVSDGVKSGTVTIRVPADRFNDAILAIKRLAIKVQNESINAQDVTEQYTDLEAQLRNLRAEETQYLEIMKKATTVEDTLNVAQRLSDVRGRIEHVEGQLQFLSRQVNMSTITTTLTEEADVEVFGIRWRPLYVIKQSFRNMLTGLTGYIDAMINILFSLPLLILWLVTVGAFGVIIWKIVLRLKKKFFSQSASKI